MAKTIGGLTTSLTAAQIADNDDALLAVEHLSTSKKMTLTELRRAAVDVVNVRDYGAVGDGVADDTDALSDAIDAAGATGVLIPPGMVIRITQQIVHTGDLRLFGGGTILTDLTDIGMSVTGDLFLDRIIFDGASGNCAGAILANAGEICSVRDCIFQNYDSDTQLRALIIQSVDNFLVHNCIFRDLNCLGNGTIGDTNGSLRAITIHAGPSRGIISSCLFENINNHNAGNDVIFEDADAIHSFGTSTGIHEITITNCRFTNIGKRCIKLQGDQASKYRVIGIDCRSGWTGTTDTSGATNNGMYAVVEALAGDVDISNVALLDGVSLYLAILNGATVTAGSIASCTSTPEAHNYVQQILTRGIYVTSAVPVTTPVTIANNRINGCYYALDISGGGKITLTGNATRSAATGIQVNANGDISISGNQIGLDADLTPVASRYGVILNDGILSANISANTIDNMQDGVYVNTQSSTFDLIVGNNIFTNLTRYELNYNAGADKKQCMSAWNNRGAGLDSHYTGTAAPVAGTWKQGDIVWNSSPAAAGSIGWVCTTAGTPGTWKTFGTIES